MFISGKASRNRKIGVPMDIGGDKTLRKLSCTEM